MGPAVDRSGYVAQRTSAIHLNGPESAAAQSLRRSSCKTLTDPDLRDLGVHRRGLETWLILASPYVILAQRDALQVGARVLALVNAARARGARCGSRAFAPTGALRASDRLAKAAAGHAADMAKYEYLEHRDRAGRTPADRTRASGYPFRTVGENIASGPTSPDEVVQGWLRSPDHCENIMDSRFTEMGIAYAPARSARRGLYWVQVLADPR